MSFKNHGPGGCCCGCYTLFDDFNDGFLGQSFRLREVVWRDTGFGSSATIGAERMVLPPEQFSFLGRGVLPKYVFEGTGINSPSCTIPDDRLGKYQTMDMGIEEFECSFKDSQSDFSMEDLRNEYGWKINADNGTIYCLKWLNTTGATPGESPMNFAIPCVPYGTQPGQKFRVRITRAEWDEHDTILNGSATNQLAICPVNIYTQHILLDPGSDPWNWVCQTWGLGPKRSHFAQNCSTPLGLKYSAGETTLRERYCYYANSASFIESFPYVDNRPHSPGSNNGESYVYNWRWTPTRTNEPYSGVSQCRPVSSRIWPRWDWQQQFAQLTLSNSGFDYQFTISRGHASLEPWEYRGESPDDSLAQVFNDPSDGNDYQVILQSVEVKLDVPGCINIQLIFGWRLFGVAPLPPLQPLRYAVLVPVDNPGLGNNVFPKPSITMSEVSFSESLASNLGLSAQEIVWDDYLSTTEFSLTQPF